MTIELNLNDLTQEKLDLALSKIGGPICTYSQPCIIGTIFTDEQMELVKEQRLNNLGIGYMIDQEFVSFPEDQVQDAKLLQAQFDGNYPQGVIEIAQKYIEKNNAGQ